MHLTLSATLALVAGIAAAAPSSSYTLHERRDAVPVEWQHKYKADPSAQVPVRVGLTQSNLDRGHDLLMEVSDHNSQSYGKYYSPDQITELFAPSEETVNAVRGWLERAGLAADRVVPSINKQWLQFDASIAELEDLVKAKYHVYEHHSGKSHVACDEYHVPADIQAHIDYITPGIKLHHTAGPAKRDVGLEKRNNFKLPLFPEPVSMPIVQIKAQMANGDLSTCSAIMTPACIKALYNITEGKLAAKGNQLGIFEDLNDHYSQADLNSFFASAYPKIAQGTHPELRGIDGAIGPVAVQDAGLESSLDFQISYPIIHPQGSVLFQTDDQPVESNYTYVGFLNNFLDAIDGSYCPNTKYDPQYPDPLKGGYKGQLQCGVYKPTNVISISYGGIEAGMPVAYQKRQCNEYMKLGMQGISIIVSSGDSGVGLRGNSTCLGAKGNVFTPGFPVNCPYVTAIGGTFLDAGKDVKKDEEIAVTRFPSGGGFSNIFPTPSYQSSAVNGFLTKFPPPYNSYKTQDHLTGGPGRFNSAGRAYPDFAAVGDRVLVFGNGKAQTIGGTSASAPVFASIINRINEERIAAGKGTVGFVNPTLYNHPNVFHDITVGTNPGCNSQGFSCAPGWDPVTGLGTPNYPALLRTFMALP